MRLYIPTCTLNFNNILSSESISPLGFYARRGFGNKRFYPVFANDKEQVILLYSKYPRFKVEENDLENYPMVIEIESEDYKEGFFESFKSFDTTYSASLFSESSKLSLNSTKIPK